MTMKCSKIFKKYPVLCLHTLLKIFSVEIDETIRTESFDLSYTYFLSVIIEDFYNSKLLWLN